jgi:hypothetical protein
MDDQKSCIICLDDSSPLFLIACGCRVAWFHPACETEWLSRTSFPPSCPICRRIVKYKILYSWAWNTGAPQKQLWNTLYIILFEIIVSCLLAFGSQSYMSLALPFQSSTILLTPFFIQTKHHYSFFILIYNLKIIIMASYIFLYIFLFSTDFNFFFVDVPQKFILFSSIYSLCFFFTQLSERNHETFIPVNPWAPFIVGRHLLHSDSV